MGLGRNFVQKSIFVFWGLISLPKRGGILQYLIPLLTGLSNIVSVAGTANELLKTIRAMKGKGLSKKGVFGDFK